jgi:GntR family transcriptional regulator, transcriptional repressor for pyruvate dehydrogenase complex
MPKYLVLWLLILFLMSVIIRNTNYLMDEIFEKIGTPLTLSQKIERNIENAIREKKLLVGSKLPTEHQLCEMFAVSRTALREALRRLSARGLIKIVKGSGMYVSEIKIEDAISSLNLYYDLKFDHNLIGHTIKVRQMFEPEIAQLAAQNRTDEDVRKLEDNLEQFIKCDPDNTQLESDLDNRFHTLISECTENQIVQITMEPIYTLLPRMRNYVYANIDGQKDNTVAEHRSIVKAIKDQDAEKAYSNMRTHLQRTSEIYEKYLKKSE